MIQIFKAKKEKKPEYFLHLIYGAERETAELVIVDELGNLATRLLSLGEDGTIYRYFYVKEEVAEELGFRLDKNGRVLLEEETRNEL